MRPILIDFGKLEIFGQEIPLAVRSYGTLFFIAILIGWWMVVRIGRRVHPGAPWSLIYLGSIFAGVIGARVLNALIFLPEILRGDETLSGILLGGGTWLPGVLAGTAALWWLSRRAGLPLGVVTNVFFVGIPLVHGIGRLACLLGGCCYGAPTDMPWGIVYSDEIAHQHNGTPLGVPVHPTPLYEFFLELVNFAVVWRLWKRGPRPWVIPATWALLYGAERFVIEFFRGDPRGQFGPFASSQWISLALVPLMALLLWRLRPWTLGDQPAPAGDA
jgi:phosphatidylglycerol:prolipoprotein diacylglycerol transferase